MERGVGSGLQCRAQQKGQAVLQAALTVPASSFTSSRGLPGTTAGRQGSGGSTGEAANASSLQPTWEALRRRHAKIHAPATKHVSSAIIDPRTRLVQVRVEGHLLHVVALAQLHKRLARRVGPVEHLRSSTAEWCDVGQVERWAGRGVQPVRSSLQQSIWRQHLAGTQRHRRVQRQAPSAEVQHRAAQRSTAQRSSRRAAHLLQDVQRSTAQRSTEQHRYYYVLNTLRPDRTFCRMSSTL